MSDSTGNHDDVISSSSKEKKINIEGSSQNNNEPLEQSQISSSNNCSDDKNQKKSLHQNIDSSNDYNLCLPNNKSKDFTSWSASQVAQVASQLQIVPKEHIAFLESLPAQFFKSIDTGEVTLEDFFETLKEYIKNLKNVADVQRTSILGKTTNYNVDNSSDNI